MPKFIPIHRRSKLELLVNTSLYPIRRFTNDMEIVFEADMDEEGKLDLTSAYNARLEVMVDKLRSDYQFIDRVVQSQLDTRRFPYIKAELMSLRETGDHLYHGAGWISFHGITKQIESDLKIGKLDSKHLNVSGEVKVNIRDFNFEPPTMMALKVEPMVTMELNLVLRRPE